MSYESFTVLMFVIFLIIDIAFPFREKSQSIRSRWATNYCLYLMNWFIERGFVYLVVFVYVQINEGEFGVFSSFDLNLIVVGIACILILDLMSYGKHWLKHRWNWLWNFHRIHHSDRDFDFTTGLRFHPIEKAFDDGSVVLTVFLLGVPFEVYLVYAYVLTFHNFAVHSNFALSKNTNIWLSWFIVTPNLHRVHHAQAHEMCDSNYGVIFTFWDRLFGTIKQVEEQKNIQTGIKAFKNPDQLGLISIMAMPFK